MLCSVLRVFAVDRIAFCAVLLHAAAFFTVAVVAPPALLINVPATRAAEPVELAKAPAPGVSRPTAAALCITSAARCAPPAAENTWESGAVMATMQMFRDGFVTAHAATTLLHQVVHLPTSRSLPRLSFDRSVYASCRPPVPD